MGEEGRNELEAMLMYEVLKLNEKHIHTNKIKTNLQKKARKYIVKIKQST